jgi:hypothetical protein
MGPLGKSGGTKIDSLEDAVIDYLTEVEKLRARRLPPQQTTEAQ